MIRQLVLIHGRAQQRRDPVALKEQWLSALDMGLRKSGLSLSAGCAVQLAYYGDTLYQLTAGIPPQAAARVVLRGAADDPAWQQFLAAATAEAQQRLGITDAEVAAAAGLPPTERGPLNWPWTLAILRVLDQRLPGASSTGIALAFHDVYQYLTNPGIRAEIDEGVSVALTRGTEIVVVGHSLGSVIAYSLLRREGSAQGWQVPLLLTVGSPLGVTAVRQAVRSLAPLQCPECTSGWFNALNPGDPVALVPLTPEHFPICPPEPRIVNYTTVGNRTSDRHGIRGYLSDAEIARQVHAALHAGC